MVPSNIKESTQSFITNSKPPTKNEKLIGRIEKEKATSKPLFQVEIKPCVEAIPKIKIAAKKARNFCLTFTKRNQCVSIMRSPMKVSKIANWSFRNCQNVAI